MEWRVEVGPGEGRVGWGTLAALNESQRLEEDVIFSAPRPSHFNRWLG